MDKLMRNAALDYHKNPKPGKIELVATKPMNTKMDLSLAYSPGVAVPCEEIAKDPLKASEYTSRGNLVAVITNGTAVLGLGDIGPLASKPVMEGKAVLFKKFAHIDSVDIEIDEKDPEKFIEAVRVLEPSFGGINLEDIKAPECFEIEEQLKKKMNIPVFHDDQHGTAIIVGAAVTNWIHLTGRKWKDVKLVASGAGASAISCLKVLVSAGLPKENIIVTDRNGVIYKGRNEGMDPIKEQFAADTKHRTLEEAIKGAHIFLGLSGPGVVKKTMVKAMAKAPLVMALANPTPEIMPEDVKEVQPKAVICTGRSDYPNQVNNVLCFPYIFRGALDVGATKINEEMKLACVQALAELTRKEATAEVAAVYSGEQLSFGEEYLIPKPFDPRLIEVMPMAVAKAAMESGVATRPIEDMKAYQEQLRQYFYQTQSVMSPVYTKAQHDPKRVVYCEGEEPKVLRAIQIAIDEGLCKPILIGRENVIRGRLKQLNLRLKAGEDFELCDPEDDPRYREYWELYHSLMERKGVTPSVARNLVRTDTTAIGAIMVKRGEADALLCGTIGLYTHHLKQIDDIIGMRPDVDTAAALNGLVHDKGTLFICDTQVNPDPSVDQLVEMTLLAAEEVKRFGIIPRVAMLNRSSFGSYDHDTSSKMKRAVEEIKMREPGLEIDGEMHADAALNEIIRGEVMPNSSLKENANLLIMPNVDAANISFNMMKVMLNSVSLGPILLGTSQPAHILTPSVTTRGLLNMTALAGVEAQLLKTE